MITALIRWSIRNRFLVLLATVMITAWGVWAMLKTPLDAIPDLSDVQVIIRTTYPGQAPQIVENQVTYPLATTMLSVPGARTVRGYSMFGDSFVYILFEDGTDPYWARSRVLEYMNQVQSKLPPQAKTALGPDATGVGWVYEYALIDKSGRMDLSQLRALQDWFLKYELKAVPNVSEVASVGGMVRQYQIVLDPDRMRAFNIPHMKVMEAVQRANQETGGSVLELAEAEYMVRASGYLQSLDDFRKIPLMTSEAGVPVRLGDVARIQVGPEMRRGIAELNGEGEVAGGIIIMRYSKNALETIDAVKAKLEKLKSSLPDGVEIVPTYDRSSLIKRAVRNLNEKLIEEFLVVALVCLVFLFHLRSALVAIVSLPLGVLMAFIVMYYQGVNANIMSLGGIAIAIGAMVDAAVVMIENAHKHIEAWHRTHPGQNLTGPTHWHVIGEAAAQVGPALFFSLLIITLSFVPVFTLEAQEGRLFSPLAYTKTYAMAAAAGLAVTLIPVLMGYLIRGRIPEEKKNPLNRGLIRLYQPAVRKVLSFPTATLAVAILILFATIYPATRIGGEFMPPLDEGDLLYMPSALPGISAGRAAAANGPFDQNHIRSRERLRQGRTRRNRDRPGAARDVRDHDPVQAAGAVACRHDTREAGRGARSHRESAGAVEYLGSADSQPHRHAGHRHQEPGRGQGGGHQSAGSGSHRFRCPARGEERAGRDFGVRRASLRWPLHRRQDRPRHGGALRAEHCRCAEHRVGRHRRGQHR